MSIIPPQVPDTLALNDSDLSGSELSPRADVSSSLSGPHVSNAGDPSKLQARPRRDNQKRQHATTQDPATANNYPLLDTVQELPHIGGARPSHDSSQTLSSASEDLFDFHRHPHRDGVHPLDEAPGRGHRVASLPTRRMPEGWAFRILRWPILCVIFAVMALELFVYCLVRIWVALHERWFVWRGRKRAMRQQLERAGSYEEWKHRALALDTYMKKDAWKRQPASAYYDHRLIQRV